jgi:amino acid permease
MTVENISNGETVIGLLNGMIGGTILVLPILGLRAGYISILLICAVMGAISCYTAYLIILHLGKASNIKESILNHFDQN